MSAYKVIDLRCPGCGEPASTDARKCKYCGREVIISSFSSVYELSSQDVNRYVKSYQETLKEHPDDAQVHTSIGMCYLKLSLHEKALTSFEKALEEDLNNSETYFYAAVALLNGKKAFLTPLATIKKAGDYIDAAVMIEPRGIYYYFSAYLKRDFYERKFLKTSPTAEETLALAKDNHVTHQDIQTLFELLNVSKPDNM